MVCMCVCVKQSSSLPDCWQASRYSIHLTTKGQKLGRRLTIVEECWGRGGGEVETVRGKEGEANVHDLWFCNGGHFVG